MEITAFESKAHAKNDYFHVGKRGEMAARARRRRRAEHSRHAGGLWTMGRRRRLTSSQFKETTDRPQLRATKWRCQSAIGEFNWRITFVTLTFLFEVTGAASLSMMRQTLLFVYR